MYETLASFARVLLLAALLPALPTAADSTSSDEAVEPGKQRQVEIFLSSIFAASVIEGSFGVRGAYQLGKRFHLEGGLSRLNGRTDIFLIDVSAKYYLRARERIDVFLLAGPGLFYSSDLDAEATMLHAGIGAEFSLGQRFYLRPELRGRWFADHVAGLNIGDFSLGLGWRF